MKVQAVNWIFDCSNVIADFGMSFRLSLWIVLIRSHIQCTFKIIKTKSQNEQNLTFFVLLAILLEFFLKNQESFIWLAKVIVTSSENGDYQGEFASTFS